MKAQSSYFKRKNSKQGLALSTAMAICIVLAILVAVLVSMASLNITTTQTAVSQREAYVQAKSALAFAESYYSQNADRLPGSTTGSTQGKALFVFKDDIVSHGAKVYITDDGANPMTDNQLKDIMKSKPDTYVEVTNNSSILDLTAYCKYGDDSYYTLSKEFNMGPSDEVEPNAFTGNIEYEAKSEIRYLRIHVRTNPAFEGHPYLYTWYTSVNSAAGDKGTSSIVNKMSGDAAYATIEPGAWDGNKGPVGDCAMHYEGNAWYVTEMKFNEENVHFVNAIVAKAGGHREKGGGQYNIDQQSWELFGIPLPKETGEKNGLDVYITLNQNKLRDAVMSGSDDEFTRFFTDSDKGNKDIDSFAQYCGGFYTVYTKKDIATLHYRKAGATKAADDNPGAAVGMTYEGYGWWRKTSNNFSDSVSISGASFTFNQGGIVSENEYGQEVIREGFIVEGTPKGEVQSEIKIFATEQEANEWLGNICGDTSAGNYVTVNVSANQQPVNKQIPTTISYESKWGTAGTLPTAGGTGGSGSGGSNSDPNDPTGQSSKNDELEFQKLDYSGSPLAVVGDFTDWKLGDFYLEKVSGFDYELTISNMTEGDHAFKICELVDLGNIWAKSYGNGDDTDGNTVVKSIPEGFSLVIEYNAFTHEMSARSEDPNGTPSSGKKYAVIGWENSWGTKGKNGNTAGSSDYSCVDDMQDNGNGTFTYTSGIVVSGQTYKFKVIEKLSESGSVTWGDKAFGGYGSYTDSDENFVFTPGKDENGNDATYNAVITFNESSSITDNTKRIKVRLTPTTATDETFYVIGSFNNWTEDESGNKNYFNKATSDIYKMKPAGDDGNGNYFYEVTLPMTQEANPVDQFYEVKVFGSSSLNGNGDSPDSINYDHSWGAADASGYTMGSDKAAFRYTLKDRSKVKFTFTYSTSNFMKSTITYMPVDPEEDVGNINVGFHNAMLTSVKTGEKTEFTTPWTDVYLTYYIDGKGSVCVKMENNDTENYWAEIPSDAAYIYFSNMPTDNTSNFSDPKYQRTSQILREGNFEEDKVSDPIFFAWKAVGTNEFTPGNKANYIDFVTDLSDASEDNAVMVWAGSAQNNYYDAPFVKVLNMLASLKEDGTANPNGGSHKYAFSAYPFSKYNIVNVNGNNFTVNFNTEKSVTYQGETYYYQADKSIDGQSFLIIQDSGGSHTGYLLEEQMSLEVKYNQGIKSTGMYNRAGGVFTSDSKYYDGTMSAFNYNDYVPNWYTYKVAVTSDLKINGIKGVVKDNYNFMDAGTAFDPGTVSTYYKQPIYIERDYNNQLKYYTYDTKTGNVDTYLINDGKDARVSVYFDNSDDKWSSVKVYAYDPKGNKTIKSIPVDDTNSDKSYYRFEFVPGQYCYFQFFDGTENSPANTAKKTPVLFLTGYENPDTHEFDILARSSKATAFEPYVHPKTLALYSKQALESASAAASIPKGYKYNVTTNAFESTGSLSFGAIDDKALAAAAYYGETVKDSPYNSQINNGPWSATDPSANQKLAVAVQQFVKAALNVRVYIAEDIPENIPPSSIVDGKYYEGSGYLYKEGKYRDDVVSYESRWVQTLRAQYDAAMNTVYSIDSNSSVESITSVVEQQTQYLKDIIENPETIISEDAVQIIVDDQLERDIDGNLTGQGGWGKANIHLYNLNGSEWTEVGYDLHNTTQTGEGFYAYVFKLNTTNTTFTIDNGKPTGEVDNKQKQVLEAGKSYMYHTATRKFVADNSIKTYRVTIDKITKGDEASDAYGKYVTPSGEKLFIVNFLYDTKVTFGVSSYTIYAGTYTISAATYPKGYKLDGGEYGINLFSSEAKKFFETPSKYGMSTAKTFNAWNQNRPTSSDDTSKDIDIMCDSVTAPSGSTTISAAASNNRNVNFRFKAEKGNDTLTLGCPVKLKGNTVNVAVNQLDLRGQDIDFTIEASSIVFLTDTRIITNNGTFKVSHGTYLFNTTNSGSGYSVSLGTTGTGSDWRNHYRLVDQTPSALGGGVYVDKR